MDQPLVILDEAVAVMARSEGLKARALMNELVLLGRRTGLQGHPESHHRRRLPFQSPTRTDLEAAARRP
ncbi:hypothetical protein GCM10010341_92270 [Streptomyces noursei]|nr:hypothetical protein GCM10010341_92270 [Streptomyces noursei]